MKKSSSARTVRTIGFMAIIIFFAKFLGLLREIIIASVYGQGYASDILNSSTQIPLLFFDMTLGVAILSTFVPVFNGFLENEGKARAMCFANSFMALVVTIAAVFSVLGMIFAEELVGLMAPGYDHEKVLETAKLLRLIFPSIIFTAAAYTSVGILQSFGEFNIPSLISVVSNLIMIAYLLIWGNKFGLTGVILSMLVAWASQLFIQLPYLNKFGYRHRLFFNIKDKGIKDALCLAVPVLVSSWVQPLCSVINMSFGSSMGDGAVSGLGWANKIYIIIVGVFAYAVTNFIFPKLSRMEAGNKEQEFSETTRTCVSWIIFIIGFVAAMFIALCEPVIRVVFERGEFTPENTRLTAGALLHYSVGMVGYAICEILNKSFYAIRDGKTPMLTSIGGICVNLASAFIFVKIFKMGINGLALASAVSSIFMAVVLLVVMNKRKPDTFPTSFWQNLLKTVICIGISALAAKGMYRIVSPFGNGFLFTLLELVLCALPALLVYLGLGFILKINELKKLRRLDNEK